MTYSFTRDGDAIEAIHNTVDDPKSNAQFSDDIRTIAGEYRGLWPDTGGSANKGDTYQTQVGGSPTGEYFAALQNTTVDPVGDDVNWREAVTGNLLASEIRDRTGVYRVGNISDYVGDTLPEADKLNSYQFPNGSGYWYGPIQSQTFPITIPADPSVVNGWALVNASSQSWVIERDSLVAGGGINEHTLNIGAQSTVILPNKSIITVQTGNGDSGVELLYLWGPSDTGDNWRDGSTITDISPNGFAGYDVTTSIGVYTFLNSVRHAARGLGDAYGWGLERDGSIPVGAIINTAISESKEGVVTIPIPYSGAKYKLEVPVILPDNAIVKTENEKLARFEVTGNHSAFKLNGSFTELNGVFPSVSPGVTHSSDLITVGIQGGGGGQRAALKNIETSGGGAHAIRISDGNSGVMHNIRCVGAAQDSVHFDSSSIDNNTWTYSGFIDLLAAGRDNLHYSPGSGSGDANSPRSSGAGSLITCQQAGRYNAYIGSVSNILNIYAELGSVADVYIDNAAGAKGNLIFSTLGNVIYSNPSESYVSHGNLVFSVNPDASRRRFIETPLIRDAFTLLDVSKIGELELSQTGDREFTLELSGSSASGHKVIMKTSDSIASPLLLEPETIRSDYRQVVIQATNGDTTPDISGSNSIYFQNSSQTNITFFDGRSPGKRFDLQFDGNTTIVSGANIKTKSGSNLTPGNNEIVSFVCNLKNSSPYFIEV